MKEILFDIIYIVITGCGLAVAKYVVTLINKKINEAQINTEIKEYEKLNQYIDSAQDALSGAVLSVTQTYVESLKRNQKFDKEAQLEAKEMAIDIAKDLITEECQKAIVTVYGDLDVYLDNMIEALVQSYKNN